MSRPRSHRDDFRHPRNSGSADLVDLVEVGGVFVTVERARSREVFGLVLALLSLAAAPWRMLKMSASRWELFESVAGRSAAALRLAPVYLTAAALRHCTDGLLPGKETSVLAVVLLVGFLALTTRLSWAISSRVTLIYMAVSICADLITSATSVASLHLWAGFSSVRGIFPIWEVLATVIAVACMVRKTAQHHQLKEMRL